MNEDLIKIIDATLLDEKKSNDYYLGVLKGIKDRLQFDLDHKFCVTNFDQPIKYFQNKEDAVKYMLECKHCDNVNNHNHNYKVY
jgi:hypothetical protein